MPDLDAGLEYPGTPTQAAGNVSTLWAADVSDHGALERGVIAPAAWNEASLRWLVAPADRAFSAAELHVGVQIEMGDVERFQATVEMFREFDDRFGGGHARDALIQYCAATQYACCAAGIPTPWGAPCCPRSPGPRCSPRG
jgi:hypothetical protein